MSGRPRPAGPDRRWLAALAITVAVLAVLAAFGVFVAERGPISLVYTVLIVGLAAAGVVRWARWTELTALSLLLLTTFALPANQVIGALGQAGVPSHVIAALLFVLWLTARGSAHLGTDHGPQPLRLLVAGLVVAQLSSYVAGQLRGLSPPEASGATSALLGVPVVAGLLLFPADTLHDLVAVQKLVYRLLCGGVVLALAGMLQFFSIYDVATGLRVPGLVVHPSLHAFVETRNGLPRVAGTATHPIEYGVVLSMLLPLGLHAALHAPRRYRWRLWTAFAVIALGIPLSVGRSAVLTSGVALLLYLVTLRLRVLAGLLPVGLVGLAGLQAAVPGLLRAITGLFRNTANDPSIQGRTDDYEHVLAIWRAHPVSGLGVGTYLPSLYRVLDNEYLYELATLGTLGLVTLAALFLTGYSLAQRVRTVSTDPVARSLAGALAATVAAAAVASATFDAFGFGIMYITTHLVIGLSAALWRVEVRDRRHRGPIPVAAPRPAAAPRAAGIGDRPVDGDHDGGRHRR